MNTPKNLVRNLAFGAALFFGMSTSALAEDEGIPVTLEVRDAATQAVVKTAVVRHPREAERHRVNSENGRWTESVLYLSDGTEVQFHKGDVLSFEVSAPGYKNTETSVLVRKRRNLQIVYLDKMELSLEEEFDNEPAISFDRDVPLDK